jgi:hypothetical protein
MLDLYTFRVGDLMSRIIQLEAERDRLLQGRRSIGVNPPTVNGADTGGPQVSARTCTPCGKPIRPQAMVCPHCRRPQPDAVAALTELDAAVAALVRERLEREKVERVRT